MSFFLHLFIINFIFVSLSFALLRQQCLSDASDGVSTVLTQLSEQEEANARRRIEAGGQLAPSLPFHLTTDYK